MAAPNRDHQTNSPSTNVSMVEGALASAARGLRVFRIYPGSKRPLRVGWQAEATSDPAAIAALWAATPAAHVGVATGEGIVVVDVDYGHGLVQTEALDAFPLRTYAVETRSGGEHWYYRVAGEPVKNSVGRIGDGIDLRADGGLVVAPPTPGYTVIGDFPIAPISRAQLLVHRGTVAKYPKDRGGFGWCPLGETVPEGSRHDYLVRAGARLAALADSPEMLSDMLLQHSYDCCDPPLDEGELAPMVGWLTREVLDVRA